MLNPTGPRKECEMFAIGKAIGLVDEATATQTSDSDSYSLLGGLKTSQYNWPIEKTRV